MVGACDVTVQLLNPNEAMLEMFRTEPLPFPVLRRRGIVQVAVCHLQGRVWETVEILVAHGDGTAGQHCSRGILPRVGTALHSIARVSQKIIQYLLGCPGLDPSFVSIDSFRIASMLTLGGSMRLIGDNAERDDGPPSLTEAFRACGIAERPEDLKNRMRGTGLDQAVREDALRRVHARMRHSSLP
ncbi:hypothetical protein CERSUDRAFT_83819 [Gelatoporia subvermispora B]|uniref:Uncharacterized protein n=1 Tax=Ceriporiopsis subvermispora (strain B) TaxID=914234 RepID=M2REB8_CERS8|nr:hypothetical protein CERSUDRAFT_83819 [Gelatoporia subvermispora B]